MDTGALVAPDFRMENAATAVTDKTYAGPPGVSEWSNDFLEAFQTCARYEVEKLIADGDDFVVARVALVGTGARSEAALRLAWIAVMWFSDGKATRAVGYLNRSDALQAVGLEQ